MQNKCAIVYYTTSVEKVKSDLHVMQTAQEVIFYLFARVLYNTFHNKGVKSADFSQQYSEKVFSC